MVARKQFAKTPAISDEMREFIAKAQGYMVTEEQLREQSVSFAFGNAPASDHITRESVSLASRRIRLNAA